MAEAAVVILFLVSMQIISLAICATTKNYRVFFISTGMLTGGTLFVVANAVIPSLWPASAAIAASTLAVTIHAGIRFQATTFTN